MIVSAEFGSGSFLILQNSRLENEPFGSLVRKAPPNALGSPTSSQRGRGCPEFQARGRSLCVAAALDRCYIGEGGSAASSFGA
jgi:hypothetical protein